MRKVLSPQGHADEVFEVTHVCHSSDARDDDEHIPLPRLPNLPGKMYVSPGLALLQNRSSSNELTVSTCL